MGRMGFSSGLALGNSLSSPASPCKTPSFPLVLLRLPHYSQISRFFIAQKDNPTKGDWVSCVRKLMIDMNINFTFVRPLLSITFPQGFRISKNIWHPISGSGGKKTVKRYLKSEQTDKQIHRRTNRLIESIGPEGRCFENTLLFMHLGPLQQINLNIYNLFEINNSSKNSRNWWTI